MATSEDLWRYLLRIKSKWKPRLHTPKTLPIFIIVLIYITVCVHSTGATNCVHGSLVNETCVCEEGWTGEQCRNCFGRASYNSTYGTITEGEGNYTVDTKCTWLVGSGQSNTTIHLWLEEFATECSWDHLYIYDGDSVFSPLLAVFSGLLQPRRAKLPEIRTKSGYAYLHFFSDAAYNMSGFNITYQVSFCPKNCSGNGFCNDTQCVCDSLWKGESCEIPVCPHNCSGQGVCDLSAKKCMCEPEYRGVDCSTNQKEGVWNPVSVGNGFIPAGRASHKSVIHNDYMWVISGDDFGAPEFQNIVRFNILGKHWEEITPRSSQKPVQRYGHSAVVHNNKIFMYGGLVGSSDIVSELWSYTIDTDYWSLHTLPFEHPVAVVGHTAHVIDNIMYVIFGHSPIYGYLNLVQECNLGTFSWQNASTSGAIVKGGYGHSSVYDPQLGLIYVHGGYHSRSYTLYYLSDSLYSYNPRTREWKHLRRSGSSRYLHTASIISGMMLVYGGNTHNDSSSSLGAKCYSTDFLAYDIKCDTWHRKDSPKLPKDISRFGHTAAVYSGKLYIFGGFNGLMLNDMYEYQPGICAAYKTKDTCLAATPGIRCVWEDTNGCLHPEEAQKRLDQKTIGPFVVHGCKLPTIDSKMCEMMNGYCPSCVSTTYGCKWCENRCKVGDCRNTPIETIDQCPAGVSSDCGTRHNCQYCNQNPHCQWVVDNKGSKLCMLRSESSPYKEEPCQPSCHTVDSCENCTAASCMWCDNEKRCVESNSYVASYPYGQCMEWTTQHAKCPATRCSGLKTCTECRSNPSCGWCDDGTNTGLGKCIEGASVGPVTRTEDKTILTPDLCPAPHWYFVNCPFCQCNGHSTCFPDTNECIDCLDLTEGSQCEWCMDGFFGNATAGGNCTACDCSGQADSCDRVTGSCQVYCLARGTIGDFCNVCDEKNGYIGNPVSGGTCYYNLTTDYRFTFNLSKKTDKYYTRISFMNMPTSPDKDVEFMINCSEYALINITVRTASKGDVPFISAQKCIHYDTRFSYNEYKFGDVTENTTFLVHVYDFKTPIWLEISFSQQAYIDLINFFIWFFSCFISLLLVAAVVWKIKLRYVLYRRRQRMLVQMQHMASRPFASANVNLERNMEDIKEIPPPPSGGGDTSRRRKKPGKPSPVTLETCSGHKAGILTLLVRLPCGDEDYTPPGLSGLALASSLVSIGGHQHKSTIDRLKPESRHRIQIKPHTSTETNRV